MITKDTQDFIRTHKHENVHTLALQAGRYPSVDMRTAITQIEGWQTAKEKLPTWAATDGVIYPIRLSMEQCSSEATALYKASIMKGETFADLTGGFGIDSSYIANNFDKAVYIERNTALCDIAQHNFKLLGHKNITIINNSCEELITALPHCNWIFADPARRDSDGRKVSALSDCEPNIVELKHNILKKCDKAMIKCSPMLDITAACLELEHVSEVHVIAVNNECKELLFVMSRHKESNDITCHCVNILKEGNQCFTFAMGKEGNSTKYAAEPYGYLYEPNAAIQKAGCPSALANKYEVEQLHANSRLYTSKELVADFPGRIFTIDAVAGYSGKGSKEILKGIKKANITVRNFPESVQSLRKRLKIAEGGDIYIFATTLANDSKTLIRCSKINIKAL